MDRLFLAFALLAIMASANLPGTARAQEKEYWFYGIQVEELEYRKGDEGEDLLTWDGDVFYGSDEVKFRWLAQGEYDLDQNSVGSMENWALFQVPISTFFDAKGGLRVDTPKGTDRWYGVIGIAGLAPQWFEVDADFFISETGDTSARLDASYELLLTNYVRLTPSAELNVALTSDPEIGVGTGINSLELGVRLGYDVIARTFSPYVGVVYERLFGQTADFARADGEDVEGWRLAIGAKLMF